MGGIPMTSRDEVDVLRFASGEMEAEDENRFLARCELEPALYREATLAVVEQRRVVAALREFVPASDLAETELTGAELARTALASPSAVPAKKPLATLWDWVRIPATLAAGLLIGMFVTRESGDGQRAGVVKENVAPVVGSPKVVAKNDPPPMTLEHQDLNEASLRQLAGLLRMEPLIPEDEAAILESHGFVVEELPALYVVDDANGKRWAVPTNRATLRYVKQ